MPKIELRTPRADDESTFLALVRSSRSLHAGWVSPPSTPTQFRAYLDRAQQADMACFLVTDRSSGVLCGVVNLSNIVRGAFRSAYMGYYGFAPTARQGYMLAGVKAVTRNAFGVLRLHRVEANIQPGNVASIALVRSCGFALEGYSPRYLKIGGRVVYRLEDIEAFEKAQIKKAGQQLTDAGCE